MPDATYLREINVNDKTLLVQLTIAEFHALVVESVSEALRRRHSLYDEPLMGVAEAARLLKIPNRLLREWAAEGVVPSYKIGNIWRFRASELRTQAAHGIVQSYYLERPGVYALRAGEHFKIGKTTTALGERVRSLQTGQAHQLELLGLISSDPNDERSVHLALAEFHVRGEWFAATDDALSALASLMEHGVPS